MRTLFLWLYACLWAVGPVLAQVSDTTSAAANAPVGGIRAVARLQAHEVPQNRTLTYTVEVSWQGGLERYSIEKLEDPVLTNLEIVGSSSSNWVGERNNIEQTVKTYEFILKPIALGMAYVDGLRINYRDNDLDESQSLMTNRLEVKVTDPILEGNANTWVIGGSVLVLLLVAGGGFLVIKRRRIQDTKTFTSAPEILPLEDQFLTKLKGEISLDKHDSVESFSALSKLYRSYLSQRYNIAAMEITTQEILDELKNQAMANRVIEETDEVLHACDVAKFSGGSIEPGKLDRVYAIVEDLLNRNKSEYIEFLSHNSQKSSAES
ncbi:MAG: hypothetical protein ACE5HO_03240 [bacterium]